MAKIVRTTEFAKERTDSRLVRLELKKVVVGFSVSVQKTKDGVLTLRLSVQVGKVGF